MQQIKRYETKEGISEMMLFLDGNTVTLTLPALSDRYYCPDMLLQAMTEMGQDGIENLLIDCEAVKSPDDIDIERFVQMEQVISKQGIRFLILDASFEVRRRLEPLLPGVVWIVSDTSGYFGQTLKTQIRSEHQSRYI